MLFWFSELIRGGVSLLMFGESCNVSNKFELHKLRYVDNRIRPPGTSISYTCGEKWHGELKNDFF